LPTGGSDGFSWMSPREQDFLCRGKKIHAGEGRRNRFASPHLNINSPRPERSVGRSLRRTCLA
jgi:hypothetical protein